jgi:hypothetical protein
MIIPRLGMPSEALETHAPDRYMARNPAFFAIMAIMAFIIPTICRGFSSFKALRSILPGLIITIPSVHDPAKVFFTTVTKYGVMLI